MAIIGLPTTTPSPLVCCAGRTQLSSNGGNRKKPVPSIGNFEHMFGAVKKDWEFLKDGISKGVQWANKTLHVPKIVKTVDDAVWLRNLEDPNSGPFEPPSWPQPSYPALSGMDLLIADLNALSTYGNYFYCMSKIWSRPLPEYYNAQEIVDYFNCRPHVVALRLLEVFFAFSFALIKIRASRVRRFINSKSEEDRSDSASQYDFGKVLKETMLNLGPTFIKVGQSLSTRPDIIGSDISKALSELHDRIPPFPRVLAMKIIEEELGSPVATLFKHISEEPVAAASFGQVYRGTTFDGCAVAIKVQRPNLHHVVARDIYILRLGLGVLRKIARRRSDIRLYADELGKGLIAELDYRLEAANASRFLEAHSQFSFMYIPKVFLHLTRKRVLTMEWVVGENPNDLLLVSTGATYDGRPAYSDMQKLDAKWRLLDLVSKGVEATLVQLLETGFLHADPHPGNLRYTTSGQIGYIDFGLMCQMERKHQLAMLAFIIHVVNADWASLVHALSEMDVISTGTNTRPIIMELENSLGEVEFNDGIPDVKFSKVLGKIISVALKYQFRMPPYFTLLLRSLASLEGLAVAADESFKTFEAAYPYVVRKLLTDNSYASRKILHSVILNRKKEFQWQRLGLFLRVGATRKGLQKVMVPSGDVPSESSTSADNGFNVSNFVLRLLPSDNGTVVRRLLMTADGASLVRALLSEEAVPVRQHLCRAVADVLYRWMVTLIGNNNNNNNNVMACSPSFAPNSNYELFLRDRRLKVVFRKVLNDARRDWVLMLRFFWASFTMFVLASTMACRRLIVSVSKGYAGRSAFDRFQIAVGT